MKRAGFWMVAGVLAALGSGGGLSAQTVGTIRGKVVDAEIGDPLPGAVIRIKGMPQATADTAGRFEVTGVPAGDAEVTIQVLGYETRKWKIGLSGGQNVDKTFPMEFTGEKLPEMVVTARADKLVPRYIEFERRRERGMGAYLRWDEIKRKNFNTVGEAARSIRGVRMNCIQEDFTCYVRMSRTPNCNPQWWVDGVNVSSFHESTPIRDVYGIEIYRGPGEVPGEFSGSNAGCGVIVLWTKSKPYR